MLLHCPSQNMKSYKIPFKGSAKDTCALLKLPEG